MTKSKSSDDAAKSTNGDDLGETLSESTDNDDAVQSSSDATENQSPLANEANSEPAVEKKEELETSTNLIDSDHDEAAEKRLLEFDLVLNSHWNLIVFSVSVTCRADFRRCVRKIL